MSGLRQPLRSGFTTGTCGAAAAKAAAVCLLTGELLSRVEIVTPKGVAANLAVELVARGEAAACFRVQKDAGDDPDVTNGAWVYGTVERIGGVPDEVWYQSEDNPHLYLTGGEGIGLVTKPGLSCPVGKHAVNPVPRKMIFGAVEEVCEQMDCGEMLLIRIAIPQGVELAASTFNPKLGITGGISVLGTSGIVEPMSEQALIETIRLEIHMKAVAGVTNMILTPGNYGENFLREELQLSLNQAVKCSNFVADAMKMAAKEGINSVLFVGHIGKLIKVAGGVENTHSKYGDRRMEILADCWRIAAFRDLSKTERLKHPVPGSGSLAMIEPEMNVSGSRTPEESLLETQLLGSNTTEEALEYLQTAGCRDSVMEEAGRRIQLVLRGWSGTAAGEKIAAMEKKEVEVVTFSTSLGILYKSSGADAMIKRIKTEELEHDTDES